MNEIASTKTETKGLPLLTDRIESIRSDLTTMVNRLEEAASGCAAYTSPPQNELPIEAGGRIGELHGLVTSIMAELDRLRSVLGFLEDHL